MCRERACPPFLTVLCASQTDKVLQSFGYKPPTDRKSVSKGGKADEFKPQE
jgi:hypothetical protein